MLLIKKRWAYRVHISHEKFGVAALKLITVYVVKLPVLGLQRAPENSEFAPSV